MVLEPQLTYLSSHKAQSKKSPTWSECSQPVGVPLSSSWSGALGSLDQYVSLPQLLVARTKFRESEARGQELLFPTQRWLTNQRLRVGIEDQKSWGFCHLYRSLLMGWSFHAGKDHLKDQHFLSPLRSSPKPECQSQGGRSLFFSA